MKKLTIIILLMFLLVGCTSKKATDITQNNETQNTDTQNTDTQENIEPSDIGKEEKNEELKEDYNFTLTDGKGNEYSLSDFRGKIVFVNFWGTWCKYCVEEMPLLEEIYQKYSDRLEILGVNVQGLPQEKDVKKVLEWVEDKDISFKILFDMDQSLANSFAVNSFPTTYMFDEEGQPIGYVPGMIDEKTMQTIEEKILKPVKD